jgi:AcrR family transcriptional regulator
MASRRAVETKTRRARVLKVVLELQRQGGPEAVTLARVSEVARVSTGSIYHQFGDKDGLLDAAFETLIQGYRDFVSARVATEGRTAGRYVRALVSAHLEWVFAHPDEARALFRTRRALPPERAAAVRRSTGAFAAEILAGLRKVAKPDEVVRMTGAIAAAVVLGPAHEIARQWLSGRLPDLDQDEAIRALSEAAWRAVRA